MKTVGNDAFAQLWPRCVPAPTALPVYTVSRLPPRSLTCVWPPRWAHLHAERPCLMFSEHRPCCLGQVGLQQIWSFGCFSKRDQESIRWRDAHTMEISRRNWGLTPEVRGRFRMAFRCRMIFQFSFHQNSYENSDVGTQGTRKTRGQRDTEGWVRGCSRWGGPGLPLAGGGFGGRPDA